MNIILFNPQEYVYSMVLRGTYCLCVSVDAEVELNVGALGRLKLTSGRYIYVGSALNGLEARLRRHLSISRGLKGAVHWHIDYLLGDQKANIESIFIQQTERRTECSIAAKISRVGKPVKGFGCSDCNCVSHLFKVKSCGFLTKLGLEKWSVSDLLST